MRLTAFIAATFALSITLNSTALAAPTVEQPATPMIEQPATPKVQGVAPAAETAEHGRQQIALVLAGGGGRGAAHIGVLKVLERHGIKPDFVCGSSIGAVIGALYCAGLPVERIEELTLNGELKKGILPSGIKWQAVKALPLFALKSLLQLHPAIGLYSGKTVTKLIERNVPENERNIEDLKIPFAAIAVDMRNTRPVWITKGNLADAVRASASVPFVYKPVKMNGSLLVDGGIRENLPTEVAKAAGSRYVIGVRLHSTLEQKKHSDFTSFLDFSDRILTILMAEIESKSVAEANAVIEPEIKDTNTYSFSREDLSKAVLAGEEAAEKALPEILRELNRSSTAAAAEEAVPQ